MLVYFWYVLYFDSSISLIYLEVLCMKCLHIIFFLEKNRAACVNHIKVVVSRDTHIEIS